MNLTMDEVLSIVAPIAVYWLYSGFYMTLGSLDRFKKYRLNLAEEEDTKNLVSKSHVVKVVVSQHLIQAAISFMVFTVSKDENQTARNEAPSLIVLARQFMVALLVFDTHMYFVHRCMHSNKFLYHHVHSWHHRLFVPYSFGASYSHPLEGIFSEMIGCTLAFFISGMSPRMSIFFFSLATIKAVDDHCGLWLGWNVFQLLFYNNTAYHEVHHKLSGSKYNFSQPFFTMWDKMLGTYMPYSVNERVEGGIQVQLDKISNDSRSHQTMDRARPEGVQPVQAHWAQAEDVIFIFGPKIKFLFKPQYK